AQTAEALELWVRAANSALQRARATLKQRLPEQRTDWSAREPSPDEQRLLERYMDAHDRADAAAIGELLHDEMRFSMPPQPEVVDGKDAVLRLVEEAAFGPDGPGHFRLVPTWANHQPAA